MTITYMEAVRLIYADYQPVARSAVRRLAAATKRRPAHPHIFHAIAIATMRKKLRYRINQKRKRRQKCLA